MKPIIIRPILKELKTKVRNEYPKPIARPNTPVYVNQLKGVVDLTISSDSEFDLLD